MIIPEICRLPGYVFGESVSRGKSGTPGVYSVHVQSNDYQGEALLESQYVQKDVELQRGQSLGELVVVRYEANRIFVAKENYFFALKDFFYEPSSRRIKQQTRFPQWEKAWQKAFSSNHYSPGKINLKGQKVGSSRWFEVKTADCRVPVSEHPHIKCLKGPPRFFPDSLYHNAELHCLYKGEDDNSLTLPVQYKGKIHIKEKGQGKERDVQFFIHGFTSPAKWHYGILKHMLGVPPYGNPSVREYWEAFEGETVAPSEKTIFSNCRPHFKGYTCDHAHCLGKKLFPDVHERIRPHCHRYQKQALKFFADYSVNKKNAIRIWESKKSDFSKPKLIEVVCTNEIRSSENPFHEVFGGDEKERFEKLVLRGFSYDWDSFDAEPAIHLSLLTVFADQLSGSSSDEHRFRKKGCKIIAKGKITKVQE